MFHRIRLPVAVLGATACVTVGSVRQESLELGLLAYYSRPPDVAYDAACQALQLEGASLKDVGPRDSVTVVLGKKGKEVVRVVVTRMASDIAAVRVLSRPTGDRAPGVLARMDDVLGGPVLGPGLRVRAWPSDTSAQAVTGSVLGVPRDTLELLSEPVGTRAAIAIAGIRRLDFQRGRLHHAALGRAIGALTGLIAGAVLGWQSGAADCTDAFIQPCLERPGAALLAGLTGAAVGAVAGQGIGRAITSDRWLEAPQPSSAASLSVADSHPLSHVPPCPDSPQS